MTGRGKENYISLSQTDLSLLLEVYTHRPEGQTVTNIQLIPSLCFTKETEEL